MRILFMGTSEFAVPALQGLISHKFELIAVVTQPDRPSGRGKRLNPPPVKVVATEHDIPVYQPEKVRKPNFVRTLKRLAPDVIVVAAFGQLLPPDDFGYPALWYHQFASFSASKVPRCCPNSVGIN